MPRMPADFRQISRVWTTNNVFKVTYPYVTTLTFRFDMRLLEREQFLLVSRGFNWIQERPFNR